MALERGTNGLKSERKRSRVQSERKRSRKPRGNKGTSDKA